MKRFISFLFIAFALSATAFPQECNVPISIQLEHTSRNTTRYSKDKRWVNLKSILERHGFTTEVHNTRVAVSLVTVMEDEFCDGTDRKMNVEIRFTDSYSGKLFYSTRLDNEYCGKYYEMENKLGNDLAKPMPALDSLIDSIHTCVINAYEVNTKHMAELAHEYAKQGEHDVALFALVQYPSCCPGYTKLRNVMLAIFRDYMTKDHSALLDIAKSVWKNRESEADARFVISLLNSVQFTDEEQRKADRLFRKIAREYPTLDLKAKRDYTSDSELKAITLREARTIGINFSISDNLFPEASPKMSSFKSQRYEYYHSLDSYNYDFYDYYYNYDSWYDTMMDAYSNVNY